MTLYVLKKPRPLNIFWRIKCQNLISQARARARARSFDLFLSLSLSLALSLALSPNCLLSPSNLSLTRALSLSLTHTQTHTDRDWRHCKKYKVETSQVKIAQISGLPDYTTNISSVYWNRHQARGRHSSLDPDDSREKVMKRHLVCRALL